MLKLRRLWLPAIAAAAGLLLAALVGLSLFGAARRIETERVMEVPWQNGVIGDVTVSMILLLPTLVTLLTALAFFVEHRGDMWKQLRVTPRPPAAIHVAKFVLIQALVALALLAALAAATVGWNLLPESLHREVGLSGGRVLANLAGVAAVLLLSLLPVSVVQFWLSARLPNLLHSVGLGLAATFASLMLYGPATARYLPYAWPGAVVMAFFPAAVLEDQQADAHYRPLAGALDGARGGAGAILFDAAHRNRHLPGAPGRPGSLGWLAEAAGASRIDARVSAAPLSAQTLERIDLLVIGAAATPLGPAETRAVVDWVQRGGSLLLLTDHEPFASASEGLAAQLGVEMSLEMIAGDESGSNRRTFAAAFAPLGERFSDVRTYGGQAVWRREARRLLPLESPIPASGGGRIDTDVPPAQLLAFEQGRGRIIVSGDAGLFGAQRNANGPVGVNDRETGNQAFVLSMVRWLLRFDRGQADRGQ